MSASLVDDLHVSVIEGSAEPLDAGWAATAEVQAGAVVPKCIVARTLTGAGSAASAATRAALAAESVSLAVAASRASAPPAELTQAEALAEIPAAVLVGSLPEVQAGARTRVAP